MGCLKRQINELHVNCKLIASFFDHKTKETKSPVSAETPSVFLCLKGIKDPVLHFYRTTTQSLVFDSLS